MFGMAGSQEWAAYCWNYARRPSGPAYVVIGVGINVTLADPRHVREIEASGVRVAAVSDNYLVMTPPSRNFIAGAIMDELLSMLVHFEREGFAPLRDAWQALDVLRDRRATVLLGENSVAGIARGVDAAGALRLESHGRLREFVSGEVSFTSGWERDLTLFERHRYWGWRWRTSAISCGAHGIASTQAVPVEAPMTTLKLSSEAPAPAAAGGSAENAPGDASGLPANVQRCVTVGPFRDVVRWRPAPRAHCAPGGYDPPAARARWRGMGRCVGVRADSGDASGPPSKCLR